jgi:hypothetical protein
MTRASCGRLHGEEAQSADLRIGPRVTGMSQVRCTDPV